MKSPLRLLFISIIFLLLITYPILSIVNKPILIYGIPLLYLFMLSVWLFIIGLMFYRNMINKREE
jgi:hypothetical protein